MDYKAKSDHSDHGSEGSLNPYEQVQINQEESGNIVCQISKARCEYPGPPRMCIIYGINKYLTYPLLSKRCTKNKAAQCIVCVEVFQEFLPVLQLR